MRAKPDPYVSHLAAWIRWRGQALEANFSAAKRFLTTLDPAARSFSYRTFSDSPYTRQAGHDPLERAIHGSLEERWEELIELNRAGAVICVTINQTNGRGRGVKDIERVRALILDDDHPPDVVDRFPLEPQIQVLSSPGRYHHYWLVDGLPLDAYVGIQRALATQYGGDNRVKALNTSMQIPGIWRRKDMLKPVLPRIHRITGQPHYTPDELDRLFNSHINQ